MLNSIVMTAEEKNSTWEPNILLVSCLAYSLKIGMYSYIRRANGIVIKLYQCQEHKYDWKVTIRSPFDCKHSIQSAIGRHIETFRVSSSRVICVS